MAERWVESVPMRATTSAFQILSLAALVMGARLVGGCSQKTAAPVIEQERKATILALNDVYRIQSLLDGRGGLDRFRALRRELEGSNSAKRHSDRVT